MAKHLWSLFCSKLLVEGSADGSVNLDTGAISLIGVIDRLRFTQLPTPPLTALFPIEACLVSVFRRDAPDVPENCAGRTSVILPSGNPASLPTEFAIDLSTQTQGRCVGRFDRFPVSSQGMYLIKVEHRPENAIQWVTDATIEVDIHS